MTDEELKELVASNAQGIAELRAATAANTQGIAELRAATAANTQGIAELRAATAANTQGIAELRAATAANTQGIAELGVSIGQMQESMQHSYEDMVRMLTQFAEEAAADRQAIRNMVEAMFRHQSNGGGQG